MSDAPSPDSMPLADYLCAFGKHWGMGPVVAQLLNLASVSAVAGPSCVVLHPLERRDIPLTLSLILHAPAPLIAQSAIASAVAPALSWIETMAERGVREGRNRTELRLVRLNEDLLRREFDVATRAQQPDIPDSRKVALDHIEELPKLKDDVALAHAQLKPSILVSNLSPRLLIQPQTLSFDGSVGHLGDHRSLQQWLKLSMDEAEAFEELFNVSWGGGVLNRSPQPSLSRVSHIIGGEQSKVEELMPKLRQRYPGFSNQFIVRSLGASCRVSESELGTEQWVSVLNAVLKHRLSGERRRYHLTPEAHCRFLQLYNAALCLDCSPKTPLLSLKFAVLLELIKDPHGEQEVSEGIFKHATELALSLSSTNEAPPFKRETSQEAALDIMIEKIRKKGPLTLRSLVRSYSNQKTSTIQKLLDEAIKQGRIVYDGIRYSAPIE